MKKNAQKKENVMTYWSQWERRILRHIRNSVSQIRILVLLLLLQNTVPNRCKTHVLQKCSFANCKTVPQFCKVAKLALAGARPHTSLKMCASRCVDDDDDDSIHDAQDTLLTTAIHLGDHGENSMMRRMNYDDGKSKSKGKGGMGKGKAALVRVTSDDHENNDDGKGKGGSSGKTGCPVQL
jgi:hypothetical protein